jgi:hypothetical protein
MMTEARYRTSIIIYRAARVNKYSANSLLALAARYLTSICDWTPIKSYERIADVPVAGSGLYMVLMVDG